RIDKFLRDTHAGDFFERRNAVCSGSAPCGWPATWAETDAEEPLPGRNLDVTPHRHRADRFHRYSRRRPGEQDIRAAIRVDAMLRIGGLGGQAPEALDGRYEGARRRDFPIDGHG